MPVFTPSDWSDRKKWLMTIAAAVIASLIVLWLNDMFRKSHPAVLSIHDTMQFRTWLGYRDDNGQEIPRSERFEGPLGVILTPIIDNSRSDDSIFIKKIKLTISSPKFEHSFTPLFTTNIHPEQPKEEWLAIEDDFTSFSVDAGDSWRKDLAFMSEPVSYNQFIEDAKLRDDLAAGLTVELRDGEPLSATCQISGEQLWRTIEDQFTTHGVFPSYVQLYCKAPKGDRK